MSTSIIDEDGTIQYFNEEGLLHRDDGPAVINPNGDKSWWENGKLHRTDGPAVEWSTGEKWWYLHGKIHRTDGPAFEWANGDKSWFQNGERHRDDGPAVILSDGTKLYFLDGKEISETTFFNTCIITDKDGTIQYFNKKGELHCEHGPAIKYANGDKFWYSHGKLHRQDGPAIEYATGEKHWFLNDKRHRLSGPAAEYSDGTKDYYINGNHVSSKTNAYVSYLISFLSLLKNILLMKEFNLLQKIKISYELLFKRNLKT